MGLYRRNITIYFVIAILPAAIATAGPLDLQVVYPKDGQAIAAVDSTFIFGSVRPGSYLSINGEPVEVHKEGGWLAYVPVSPGEFRFRLMAQADDRVDTMTLTVTLPELPDYSFDSLYFSPGSFRPGEPLAVRRGDRVEVALASLPYCNAFCVVAETGDTVAMRELPPVHYYGRATVFEGAEREDEHIGDTLLIRGRYAGEYIVPASAGETLTFVYHVYPPSLRQVIWLANHALEMKSSILPLHKISSLAPIMVDTSDFPVVVLDESRLPVAELKDSLTIIRTGPRKGYLCVHQPAGIRAAVAGWQGRWLKLKLSDYQYGWVLDTSVVMLPEGSLAGHSYIRRVRTADHGDRVSVIVATSARHAFRVAENTEENSITLLIYGADSDTDWIRYDNRDALIDHIAWFQPEPGVYGLKIYLTEGRIWGYDGYYVGSQLHFDIRKFPGRREKIDDFRFVIDPGHSPDPGAVGPTGLTEREINLTLALRLKKALERRGAEVILTRSDSSSLALYDRPKIAVRERAEIFISIHNNALPDGTNPFVNNGVSTYYYHPHSAPLAHAVQKALVRRIGLSDFGWYHGNLAVNRPTQYPAILIEYAFMMIPEHEAKLKTAGFQKRLIRATVEGIEDFLRGRALSDWDRLDKEMYGW